MLFLIISIIGGIWGLLTLIGYTFSDAKCVNCGYYGPIDYMVPVGNKKYKHQDC
jgi:hypothetical protein